MKTINKISKETEEKELTEEQELTEDQLLGEDNPCGQHMHDLDGRFSSADSKGSYTGGENTPSSCDKGQYRRGKNSGTPGPSTEPCGRRSRDKKCSGETVKEEKLSPLTAPSAPASNLTHRDIAQRVVSKVSAPHRSLQRSLHNRSPSQLREAVKKGVNSYCRSKGFRSFESFLKLINKIDLAQSGDLYKGS